MAASKPPAAPPGKAPPRKASADGKAAKPAAKKRAAKKRAGGAEKQKKGGAAAAAKTQQKRQPAKEPAKPAQQQEPEKQPEVGLPAGCCRTGDGLGLLLLLAAVCLHALHADPGATSLFHSCPYVILLLQEEEAWDVECIVGVKGKGKSLKYEIK